MFVDEDCWECRVDHNSFKGMEGSAQLLEVKNRGDGGNTRARIDHNYFYNRKSGSGSNGKSSKLISKKI